MKRSAVTSPYNHCYRAKLAIPPASKPASALQRVFKVGLEDVFGLGGRLNTYLRAG